MGDGGDPKLILPVLDEDRRRFWGKVEQRGDDECWPWLCGTNYEGRGRFSLRRQTYPASRVAFALTFGEPDAFVCHTCDNPICCNPKHLFVGTPADNTHDCMSKGRFVAQKWTHCENGHEYTLENSYLRHDRNGRRQCRTCSRIRARRYKARQKIIRALQPKPEDYRLKKHCKRGHKLDGDNVLLCSDGGQIIRRCKICRQASEARRGR